MTPYEYGIRMKAYQRSQLEREYEMHLQAYLNFKATATKKSGKETRPVYRTFREFFDYEKKLKNLYKKQKTGDKPQGMAARYIAYQRMKDKENE